MSSPPADSDATEKLIVVLQAMLVELKRHADPAHKFRFVSGAQAQPIVAYARWIKNGGTGPEPVVSMAEFRAGLYDQAETASQLRTFPKVAGVAGVELAEATLAGLTSGHIIVTYTVLRSLIERTAHAVATAKKLRNLKDVQVDGAFDPVWEHSETIFTALYGTQREWTKLVQSDFRKTSVKSVKYVKKSGIANALPDNILDSIDTLNKTVPGTRLVYEILCEYLHPNVGDLFGATLEADSDVDRHGTRHLVRRIGLGPKSYKGHSDLQVIRDKLFDVCCDILPRMPMALDEIVAIANTVTNLSRRALHGAVKKHYRQLFLGSDPCPCLSGQTVAACTGLRDP
jgi:hypothetical protein